MQIRENGIMELVDYAEQSVEPRTTEIKGRTYSNRQLHLVKEPSIDCLKVKTLDSLVTYIKEVNDVKTEKLTINILSSTYIEVTKEFDENTGSRETVITAEFDSYEPTMDRYVNSENMVIQLRSQYVANKDSEILLKLLGTIKQEAEVVHLDDGISQSVTTQKGVRVEMETLPKMLVLKPFRTFNEIEQVESVFIIRLNQEAEVMIKQADGGVWKLEVHRRIKEYLENALEGEKVVVL